MEIAKQLFKQLFKNVNLLGNSNVDPQNKVAYKKNVYRSFRNSCIKSSSYFLVLQNKPLFVICSFDTLCFEWRNIRFKTASFLLNNFPDIQGVMNLIYPIFEIRLMFYQKRFYWIFPVFFPVSTVNFTNNYIMLNLMQYLTRKISQLLQILTWEALEKLVEKTITITKTKGIFFVK